MRIFVVLIDSLNYRLGKQRFIICLFVQNACPLECDELKKRLNKFSAKSAVFIWAARLGIEN